VECVNGVGREADVSEQVGSYRALYRS